MKIHFSVLQQFKLDLYHPFLTFLECCLSHTPSRTLPNEPSARSRSRYLYNTKH